MERPRLTRRLGSPVPLAVLRAPSGFGKTVAVTQWLNGPSCPAGPVVWIRADPGLDAHSFWTEIAGLMTDTGVSVTSGDAATHRTIESSLRRHATMLTLVIDDFDEVSDVQIENDLLDLVRYCQNLRLVVCLRSSRHFPNTLKVDIETTFIESHELAFTVEEIAAISPRIAHLSDDWAREVHRCTAGWPEPTRAVLLALSDDPQQSIDDAALSVARLYLETRVLPALHQDAWLDFALLISIPERLTDDVARYVTGDEAIHRRLERLESAGVMIATSHRGIRMYRWPDAARNALREEYARRHREDLPALHRRLAQWYLDHDDPGSAARHAVGAADTALLVRIVERFWGTLLHHDMGALDGALTALPMDAILASPRATAARDIRMHLMGEVTDAAVLAVPDPLPTQEQALKSLAASASALTALHTAVSFMVATRMRGMSQHALDYAGRTEIIGRHAIPRRFKEIGTLLPSAMLQTGITRLIFGDLARAESTLRLACQTSSRAGEGYVRRDAAGKLALLHALQGDTASAETWLRRHDATGAAPGNLTPTIERSALLARALVAIDRLRYDQLLPLLPLIDQEFTEERSWRPFIAYVHARRCLFWGDRRGTLRLLEDEISNDAPWLAAPSTMEPLLRGARVDILLSLGLGGRARAVLEQGTPHPALQPAAARLALMTGDDAAAHLAMAQDAARAPGPRTELLLVAAIARQRQGDTTGAADSLTEALQTARAAGSLAPFAMVPRDDLRWLAGDVPEVTTLLDGDPLRRVVGPFGRGITLIKLTDRERSVLNRIASGGTLQEIAAELFVSHNTIKSQVRSLYAKLGANSRSAALTNAAHHGLLGAPAAERN